jgi:hypothetical protein
MPARVRGSALSHPVFRREPSTHHMCAQEVHTYNHKIEILEK